MTVKIKLSDSITTLKIGGTANKSLINHGINTLEKLITYSATELSLLPKIGCMSIYKIRNKLNLYKLHLKGDVNSQILLKPSDNVRDLMLETISNTGLMCNDIFTIKELISYTANDFFDLDFVSKKVLENIEVSLEHHGYSFKKDVYDLTKKTTIAKNIIELCQKHGSISKLSLKTGISRKTLLSYTNNSIPTFNDLNIIAENCNVSLIWLANMEIKNLFPNCTDNIFLEQVEMLSRPTISVLAKR